MPDIIEFNVETGQMIERNFTAEEIQQREQDLLKSESLAAQLKQKYDEDVYKRSEIINKFISMGFSQNEAETLVPEIDIDYRIRHLL